MHSTIRDVRWIYSSTLILILVTIIKCETGSLEQCLSKDSISCLQIQLYRNARELLNQQSIDIVGGMSLIKMDNNRSAKSIELVELEDSVENATDVMSRQEAIDKFLIRKARDVLIERTLKWNVGETVRTFVNSIPEAIKAKFTTYVTEARGKGKKLIRILVPLLIGLKLKMAAMSALTYLGIGFLAKKAILASLISLIVSGFIGLKKLLAAKQAGYNDIPPPTYHPVPVWNPHTVVPSAMWPSHYDNHADPLAAQQLAYGSSKSR